MARLDWMKRTWLALLVAVWAAGCETSDMENQGNVSLAELQGVTETETPAADGATATGTADGTTDEGQNGNVDGDTADGTTDGTTDDTGGGDTWEIDGPITWLHTDVSGWPVTASLNASIDGGTINMPYTKSRSWPAVDGVNANPWVIVKWSDGKWYAATFEYFRFGQTSKPVGVLDGSKGDHIKRAPLSGWRPRSGERFGMMVSGLARSSLRNVRERSNIDMVTWP